MAKLTKKQLERFRLHRERGATISEAKRLARMTYEQIAEELSSRLRSMAQS